ncbi:MAG TPA: hypothetical protein VFW22_11125 [Pseudolabrys sp.]|nr:hypothetical protein [Pseudolabrys sp.]
MARRRQIFAAAEAWPNSVEGKIVTALPRLAPIGPHDDAGLIVVQPHHLGALEAVESIVGISDGKVGRARGDGEAQQCDSEQNPHLDLLPANSKLFYTNALLCRVRSQGNINRRIATNTPDSKHQLITGFRSQFSHLDIKVNQHVGS